jgi:hypothetical protein
MQKFRLSVVATMALSASFEIGLGGG